MNRMQQLPGKIFVVIVIIALTFVGLPAPLIGNAQPSYAPMTCSGLFFSEYIEGSSNNKALEIFNGTGATVNLSGYSIEMYFNGSATAGLTIDLAGSVIPGDVFVAAHASADAAILAQADLTNGSGWYNGNDAIVLRQNSTIIDVIGQVGSDPGSQWGTGLTSTADNTLRRKSTVLAGDATSSDVFNPAVEWDGFDTDTFAGLGAHSASCSSGDTAPAVSSTTPASGASGVAVNSNLTINFSENVNVAGSWYTFSCTGSGAHTAVVTGGPQTFTLNPDVDFVSNEICTVALTAANVTDQDANDPPDSMAANYNWTFDTTVSSCPTPPNTLRTISAIQGSGATTPFSGQPVTVRGTVVADFQSATQLNGFFIQDAGDGNAATSDGLFIYYSGTTAVAVGDAVQVSGTATEYNGLTEIGSGPTVTICGTPLAITATSIDLPVPSGTTLEPYEGMLVTFPETLTADQNFFQGRYGQVTLSSDGRMYNPTNGNGLGDTADLNLRRMLVLDDGSSDQNPNPIPYIGADNTLRAGDTLVNLTGVIDYGPINSDTAIRHYRLHPTVAPVFTRANVRAAAPAAVGGEVRVASFNVLNYFNGNGSGGGFPTSRGADTLVEFNRQRDKIISAIVALNTDVVGLMEIENDGTGALSAIQDLVNGLNAATALNTYAFVSEPAPGSDAIKVALIYRPGRVTPIGSAQNYQDTSNPTYNPLFDRPPLAQRFQAANGEQFFVVVNHFKSKGSCPTSGDDLDYGQGCWNAKRIAQATGLLTFIGQLQATDPDVFVIGDLNAYGAEDPINTLVAGGLVNQALRVPAATRYSYVFDGQAGYLDQALSTATLDPQITGVTYWHINADEPSVIDYNTEFKPQDLYTATPYRASDHDPMLIGFNPMPISQADFGDSANSFGVAWHRAPHNRYLGSTVTDDNSFALNADNTSDDGVTRASGQWRPNQTVTLDVQVTGGSGWLTGWFDWNLDGDFEEANEKAINQGVAAGANSISVIVPGTALIGNGSTNSSMAARFRLYESSIEPSRPAAPNVAVNSGGTTGGEVEDYVWNFSPTAINLHTLNAGSSSLNPWLALTPIALGLFLSAGYLLRKRRSH